MTDDGSILVTVHIEVDFPGGRADLRHRFLLEDDLLRRVEIAP